jgi:hypothetical protein
MYRGSAVLGRSDGIVPTLKKQRSCTTNYYGYVDYPMTVCSRWGDLVTGLDWNMIEASPAVPDRTPRSQSAKCFKLPTAQSAASRVSRFCRVSGGPWFARVTTTESCDDSIPDLSVLEILGAPESFATTWAGDITKIPAPFRQQVFFIAGLP